DPGDASKPPGLFAGITPITPSGRLGSDLDTMLSDLGSLFAGLAANGAGKTAVVIAAMAQAVKLKASVGPKWDFPILASTALATGTVAVLELASFVSGFSSVAEFDVTRVGAVHMEDTSPSNITGGTPSPATPVKSLFQIDAMALRTNLWGAWGLRAPGH